jgi:predicted nucleic acid-binding protein
MSDRFFVDTNILMYAHDKAAGAKYERAKAPLDSKATREIITDYLTWHVVVNGGESILEALDLEERCQISFWDALVIQAAHTSGAEILYSEDLSDGQTYGAVRVINPLRAGA